MLLEELSDKFAWQIKLASFPYVRLSENDIPTNDIGQDNYQSEMQTLSLEDAKALKALVEAS